MSCPAGRWLRRLLRRGRPAAGGAHSSRPHHHRRTAASSPAAGRTHRRRTRTFGACCRYRWRGPRACQLLLLLCGNCAWGRHLRACRCSSHTLVTTRAHPRHEQNPTAGRGEHVWRARRRRRRAARGRARRRRARAARGARAEAGGARAARRAGAQPGARLFQGVDVGSCLGCVCVCGTCACPPPNKGLSCAEYLAAARLDPSPPPSRCCRAAAATPKCPASRCAR